MTPFSPDPLAPLPFHSHHCLYRAFRNYFSNNCDPDPSCLAMHSQRLKPSQQHPPALLQETVVFQKMELLRRVGSWQPPRALNHPAKGLYWHGPLKLAAQKASQPDLTDPYQQAKLKRCSAPTYILKPWSPSSKTNKQREAGRLLISRSVLLLLTCRAFSSSIRCLLWILCLGHFCLAGSSAPAKIELYSCSRSGAGYLALENTCGETRRDWKIPTRQSYNTETCGVSTQPVLPVGMDSLSVTRLLMAICTEPNTLGLSLLKLEVPKLLYLYKY